MNDNFYKAHIDIVEQVTILKNELEAQVSNAFAQKKTSILKRWIDKRERFQRDDAKKWNKKDFRKLRYGNHIGRGIGNKDPYPNTTFNTHPEKSPFHWWTTAKYRIWFVRSGQQERVNDPAFGLLYLPDGRLFMPIAWVENSKEISVRFVESLPSPFVAENLLHYEEFDSATNNRFQSLLTLCGINNAARMRIEDREPSAAKIVEKETKDFFTRPQSRSPHTGRYGYSFQDPLTGNCYCRSCSEGFLYPKKPAIKLIVRVASRAAADDDEMFIKRLLQRHFVPTINPTASTFNYTISTQNFVKDFQKKIKKSYSEDKGPWKELGFWKLSKENSAFTMHELAEALPNNVYKLLMEHNIDTAAFGMWTTASFLGTATHNALDLAYDIHEPPSRQTTRFEKSRSAAIDISRAYPGICTLAATAAYDFWINKILRADKLTATHPNGADTAEIEFHCVPGRVEPDKGPACLFSRLWKKNVNAEAAGVIMRPDYVFADVRCTETSGNNELFAVQTPFVQVCQTPRRAGQPLAPSVPTAAAASPLDSGKTGVAVEYKTRWGRLDIDSNTLFQYKLQALLQADAIGAQVAILHITTVPYTSNTNHVTNDTYIADTNNEYMQKIKTLEGLVNSQELNFDADIETGNTVPLVGRYSFLQETFGNAQRAFRAETNTHTLFFKATFYDTTPLDEEQALENLDAVIHKCLVTIE